MQRGGFPSGSIIATIIVLVGFFAYQFAVGEAGNTKNPAAEALRQQYPAFSKYFHPVDTLFFDYDGLVLGEITNFVYLGRWCALFDRVSGGLYCVDLEKKVWVKATVDDSLPGYRLDVLGMTGFGEDGFIVSIPPSHYVLFGVNGRVRRVFTSGSLPASTRFAAARDRIVIYCHRSPEDLFVAQLDMSTGRVRNLFRLEDVGRNLRNLLYRNRFNGGFLWDGGHRYFVADPYENLIYVYDVAGKLVGLYKSSYREFRKLKRDAPGSTPSAIMEFMRQSRKTRLDVVYSVGFVEPTTILASYAIGGKLYAELFDSYSGRVLNRERIVMPLPLKHCANGFLFLEGPPKTTPTGELRNPYLIRFALNRELQ